MNLFEYKDLIDKNPLHIATVNEENNPNLAVAADVKVIDENKIIISVNEMINTQKNIRYNHNVVLTIFNEKWEGLRIFGTAEFYSNGKYYDLCKKIFFENVEDTSFGASKPKGVIVITVSKISKYV